MVVCIILAISFWALWYNRNKIYHEGIKERDQDIVGFINAYNLEIEQLGKLSITLDNPSVSVWEPLEGEVIKFIFDAFYNH